MGRHGALAQLGERQLCKLEVAGSIPARSNRKRRWKRRFFFVFFGDDRCELERQIRITVLHEVAHYFGLDEDRLAELGYE